MLDFLAHELGHFLALSFCLPDAMADPRIDNRRFRSFRQVCGGKCNKDSGKPAALAYFTGVSGRKASRRERVLNAEIEAWELASKIRPQIPAEVVEYALETYGMKWRNWEGGGVVA